MNCQICARPKQEWPMAFRGDRACSVQCEKAMQRREREEMPTTENVRPRG